MKYKILPGCDLFAAFQSINERAKTAEKAAKDWIKENLPESNGRYQEPNQNFSGGIVAVTFSEKPKGWVDHNKQFNLYRPKAESNIWDQWERLPQVEKKEVKDLIRYGLYKGPNGASLHLSTFPGIVIAKEFVLIEVAEYATAYVPVHGMVEITVSEFNKLKESVSK